jgi:methionyl-tRNA synthetase
MLKGAGFRRPTGIFAHGFLTVNGQKMSKSRGTFIRAQTWLDHLPAEYLRYYFAAKLGPGIEDLDLNLDDFINRINADLVGKYVNIASRVQSFIHTHFDARLSDELDDPALFDSFRAEGETIAELLEAREFGSAVRAVMALADRANQYVADKQPWVMARNDGATAELQAVCTTALNLFRQLTVYLKPVLPETAARAEAFLNDGPLAWADADRPLLNHAIARFKPLLTRVEPAAVQAMVDASKDGAAKAPADDMEPIADTIAFDDFQKLDLRVARIDRAETVEGADKLLRLRLDLGGEQRQVLAGIKAAYKPEQLQGRLTVMAANLAPRKMRFGVSEGMLLAAGPGGEEIFLLAPDSGAQPGMRIK